MSQLLIDGGVKSFSALLERQREWSLNTFGPGERLKGVLDHIRKELVEVEQSPKDLSEWIDVMILAVDGAHRQGFSPADILAAYAAKIERNMNRKWPDWRTMSQDQAITHIKDGE